MAFARPSAVGSWDSTEWPLLPTLARLLLLRPEVLDLQDCATCTYPFFRTP
jgi:hypothetical protein